MYTTEAAIKGWIYKLFILIIKYGTMIWLTNPNPYVNPTPVNFTYVGNVSVINTVWKEYANTVHNLTQAMIILSNI